ncbi:unnamed protein product [Prunus brigantina]
MDTRKYVHNVRREAIMKFREIPSIINKKIFYLFLQMVPGKDLTSIILKGPKLKPRVSPKRNRVAISQSPS